MALWIWLLLPCVSVGALPEHFKQAPASGVLDAAGLFDREPDALKRITAQLAWLRNHHDYRIYLVVEPVLMSGNATDLAALLHQEWLPDGDGLVVVYESDSRNVGFGRDAGGEPDPSSEALVPTHETIAILKQAMAETDSRLPPGSYAEALCGQLAMRFGNYFQRRDSPPPREHQLRYGLLAVGGFAILALVAIVVGFLARSRAVAGPSTFNFPHVDQPERLGAPSGARVTTCVFKNPENH